MINIFIIKDNTSLERVRYDKGKQDRKVQWQQIPEWRGRQGRRQQLQGRFSSSFKIRHSIISF